MPDGPTADAQIGVQVLVQLARQPERERLQRALDLQQWLHDTSVIARAQIDVGMEVWIPGALWRRAVDVSAQYPFGFEVRDNTVEVSAEIEVYSSFANAEDATCERCGTALRLPGGRLGTLLEQWVTETEPKVTCEKCGWTALFGDWPTANPVAVAGAPAVTFTNWPPLRASFVADVYERLGGERCRYIRQRI